MAEMVIEVTVGDPETGLWCGTCLLPSVVAIPVMAVCGSRIVSLTVFRECPDCGPVPGA